MKVSLIRARYHSVWEPLNLMYISAYLKRYYKGDIEIEIFDGFFDSDEGIVNSVSDSDFVGFSGTTPQIPHILYLSNRIKKMNPNVKIIAGGFGPTIQPHKFINNDSIDYVVLGEGEISMLDIINGRKNNIVSNSPINDINSIPVPDRKSVNLEKYIKIAKRDEGRRVTSVISERGCAFGCTFCAEGEFGTIWRKVKINSSKINQSTSVTYGMPKRLRLRDPKLVVNEMIQVKDEYDIEFFKMSDAETNPTKNHFIGLCKEIINQKLNIPWGCNMRADKLDEEMCKWAVRANCEEFWIGLESGSDEIHKHINKGVTIDMIRNAFKVSKKYNIKRRSYILIGTPPETFETIKITEAFVDEVQPDVIGISILCPYPGTIYWRPEFEKFNWQNVDEYSNTFWRTKALTNDELRNEQGRLLDKYKDKLSVNFNKKIKSGIIKKGYTLDSLKI